MMISCHEPAPSIIEICTRNMCLVITFSVKKRKDLLSIGRTPDRTLRVLCNCHHITENPVVEHGDNGCTVGVFDCLEQDLWVDLEHLLPRPETNHFVFFWIHLQQLNLSVHDTFSIFVLKITPLISRPRNSSWSQEYPIPGTKTQSKR